MATYQPQRNTQKSGVGRGVSNASQWEALPTEIEGQQERCQDRRAFKKSGTSNTLNAFERLNNNNKKKGNRKTTYRFGIREILATSKKAISVSGESENHIRTG